MQWLVVANKALRAKLFVLFLLASVSLPAFSEQAQRYQIDIASQNVEQALRALANVTAKQLLFPYDLVESLESTAVSGRYTLISALDIILTGTPLSGELTEDGVILITLSLKKSEGEESNMKSIMNRKKNILASTIAFFVGAGGVQGLAAEEVGVSNQSRIDEIIVTANKRGPGQSIQDSAMSITALTGGTIAKRGFLDLSDFAPAVPGVAMLDFGPGDKRVFMRGLGSASDQQSLTNAYLGEIPLSTGGNGTVDLRLVDIERIEVLKGPQGTQYGSGSLSGTLRYIPVAPNLDTMEGSIEVDFATFSESDDTSESFTGVFNAPLIDGVLGLRIAAYHFEDAGINDYVSNETIETFAAITGNQVKVEEDADSMTTTGIRASLLWDISDELNINLTLGTQDQELDGSNYSFDALGTYQGLALETKDDSRNNDADYASLVVNFDLGWAELTSSSTMLSTNLVYLRNTYPFAPILSVGPTTQEFPSEVDSLTQEFRLSSQLEGPLQYLAGLYYEDIEREGGFEMLWHGVPFTDTVGAYGPAGAEYGYAANDGVFIRDSSTSDQQQFALFSELSYQLNEVLELTVGARHFDYDQSSEVAGSPDAVINSAASARGSSNKGQTYKANLSFTPNDNTLIYTQWSEGFRIGRAQNVPPASTCDVDNDGFLDHTSGRLVKELEPDVTENIELGAKFTLLDNRLMLNTTVYQMDWTNLPQVFRDTTDICFGSIFNNVGEVRSEGVEVELSYLVTEALSVDLALSYNESNFTKTTDDSSIEVGEELAFAPHSQANLGVEYRFDVSSYPMFIRTDINYRGEAESFTKINDHPTNGDYINIGLRAGINIDQWELALYGNNLLNEDAATFYDAADISGRLRPRKLGLNVKYAF